MTNVTEINATTGEVTTRPLTLEEQASIDTLAAQTGAQVQKRQRLDTAERVTRDQVMAIKQKFKDGNPLTPVEVQQVLRWLVIRVLGGDIID
jgi:thiosulfate reductase cytochrome b subunit